MNNTTNLSAPTSPSGNTVEATINSLNIKTHNTQNFDGNDKLVSAGQQQQQQDSEEQKPTDELARSKPLSDISPDKSPGEAPAEPAAETPAPALETLKVKIKNNVIAPATNPLINDRNNNTSNKLNNISNNKPIDSPTLSSKNSASPASTPKSTNSKAGGRKSKLNNGDTSSATRNSTSSSINSSFSSTGSDSPATSSAMNTAKAQPIMNNYQNSSPAENGNKATPSSASIPLTLAPLSNQSPQVQPTQPMQPTLQTQSQQPPLPLIPQPQASAQPPPTLPPANLPAANPSSASTNPHTTPKPKATRAKKQPAANSKNANATDAIKPPKPEAKTRTKKAKQTAETKKAAAAAAASGSATTPATTLASTQPLLPISSATTSAPPPAAPSSASDKKVTEDQRQSSATSAKKRKPRATPATDSNAQPTNPPKRTRKKKSDQVPPQPANDITAHINPPPPPMSSNMTLPPLSVNPQLLSVASNVPMGASPLMSNAPQPTYPGMQPLNRNMPGISPLDVHDHHQRYVSVSLSPYANLETNSLARQHSLSKLLFTSSSATSALQTNPHSDEIAKAFEELRDHSWTHLSKCILEPAQQFDIPSLIGALYELRADNERQLKRVKDLTLQREQLAAMNAKLDLTGPMLLQNLNQTSPSFASVAAAIQNSPKSLPNSSPSPAMNKSPIVTGGAYNHVPPGSSLGPPGILYDRNSPMVGLQTQHSGVNSLKSSMISTPSPPTGAFMAHGANNRSGLMTVNNSPYMSSVHPSMSALNPLGGQAPPSYYPRQ